MTEALGDLWTRWTAGPGSAALVGAFLVMMAVWLASAGLTLARAHGAWRPVTLPTFSVLLVPFVIAAVGISRPNAFPWFVVAGAASAPVLAFGVELVARMSVRTCLRSHSMAAQWSFCPQCPSPLTGPDDRIAAPPPVAGGFVSRSVATLLRRPLPPDSPVAAPIPHPAPAVDDVLVTLVPVHPGGLHVVVRRPGAAIGRDPAADICIDDPTVSWEHARILTRDGAPALVDLGSSNGSYVNGERVDQSLLLTGDTIQFGDAGFTAVRP